METQLKNSKSVGQEEGLDPANSGESLENRIFILPILTGYNLKNFDLPILDCFLNCNLLEDNPVTVCRALAVQFVTVKETKDFTNFSPFMVNY
jgi:hypothetical protein